MSASCFSGVQSGKGLHSVALFALFALFTRLLVFCVCCRTDSIWYPCCSPRIVLSECDMCEKGGLSVLQHTASIPLHAIRVVSSRKPDQGVFMTRSVRSGNNLIDTHRFLMSFPTTRGIVSYLP